MFWILALVASLVPLIGAVAIIANRSFLPYTSGAVCNKSGVAALLGVMDAVAPYQGSAEFPDDLPFEEYMTEQEEIAASLMPVPENEEEEGTEGASVDELALTPSEEAALNAAAFQDAEAIVNGELDAVGEGMPPAGETQSFAAVQQNDDASALGALEDDIEPGATSEMSASSLSNAEPPVSEQSVIDFDGAKNGAAGDGVDNAQDSQEDAPDASDEEPLSINEDNKEAVEEERQEEDLGLPRLNAAGNMRHGEACIRALGMVAESCRFVYEDDKDGDLAPETNASIGAAASSDTFLEATDGVLDVDEAVLKDGETLEVMGEPVEDEELVEGELPIIAYETAGDPNVELSTDDSTRSLDEDEEGVESVSVEGMTPEQNEAETLASDEQDALSAQSLPQEPQEEDRDSAATVSSEAEADTEGEVVDLGSTQVATTPRQVETVDSLMAQIDAAVPAQAPGVSPRVISNVRQIPPVVPDTTPFQGGASRAALLDVPDPAAAPADPLASSDLSVYPSTSTNSGSVRNSFTVIGPNDPVEMSSNEDFEPVLTSAPEPQKKRRGLGGLFGRKKRQDISDDWNDSDYDFEDDGWKGGATGVEGTSEDELRDAITSLGDDELLGHDIWFVATGASECGNAGMKAFLDTHREHLRGVFLINLESVGAGRLGVLATEGEGRVLKGDKRIMSLVQRVSSDFHNEFESANMPFIDTDAHAAMELSLRSLTIAGLDAGHLACAHSEVDLPVNVDADNVSRVADVVTEVIRRS